jgi:hypothetical protein
MLVVTQAVKRTTSGRSSSGAKKDRDISPLTG